MNHSPRAVILLSGGLDSLTCLALAQHEGYQVFPISFDYGQKHRAELEAAAKICAHYHAPHKVIKLHDLGQLGGSALTSEHLNVADHGQQAGIPNTYVPARNIVFLSIALAYAEVLQADKIYIGVSSVDYSGYPDCRPEFIQAFQHMTQVGTKAGVEGKAAQIVAPLQHLSKAETVQLGARLKVDYSLAVSCYRANAQGQACGQCDSCHLRKQGFRDANLADPTRYSC